MSDSIPRVFVSYSHDSRGHKQWVAELAARLRRDGIDAILDQWELSLGDDITRFMEDGLSQSDRVLVICTENYVRKADAGEGGVAYERMIVTAELVQNLGTQKFIPVIKQESSPPILPKFLGARFYVNLSNENDFEEQYDILLRELHKQPALRKPPIGKNPFSVQPSGQETPTSGEIAAPIPKLDIQVQDATQIYQSALDIARRGDLVAWRKIVKDVRKSLNNPLHRWREQTETTPISDKKELLSLADKAVSLYAPLFVIAIAGVESGRDKFKDQRAVVDEILNPQGWGRSGYTYIVDFPETLAFVFQGIHGAVCLDTDQLNVALALARMNIDSQSGEVSKPLYHYPHIMGWPESLGGECTTAWQFLIDAPDRWPWLIDPFGSKDDFQVAISAYYMALNILELADTIASGKEDILTSQRITLEIPLCFVQETQVPKQAYRLLLRSNPEQIWESVGVKREKMMEHWSSWIQHMASWLRNVYGSRFLHLEPAPHKSLFQDLDKEV